MDTLTASILQPADRVGQQLDAAQEAGSLLLVDFPVIPHADGYGVALPNISGEGEESV